VVGILLIAFILFAVLSLTYVVFHEGLKEKRKKAMQVPPQELHPPVATGKLIEEREFEPIPTVTENTTDLLPQERARKV
jgi:hypothetical protein